MHIVMLHDMLSPEAHDDAADVVWQLGLGLIAAGQRVTFISTTPGPAQVEQRGGITVHHLHSRYATRWSAWYGLFNPQTVLPLLRTLRALKPDIVHAHDVRTHLSYHSLVLGRRAGAATAFTSRDTLSFAYRPLALKADTCDAQTYRVPLHANWRQAGLGWNPTRNLSIRHTMRYYTDLRIAVSVAHRQALAGNHLPRFEVIHDGLDLSAPVPDAAVEALRQRLRLRDRPVILFVTGAPGLDGEPQMLAALRRVRRDMPNVALWAFAADTSRAERLRRDNPDLGDALVTGDGATRAAACALADVLAFPRTAFEPWPLAVLEAMAAGTPPVVSCFGGAPEAVIDGETGYVVDPRRADALAERIARLLTDADLRRRFGEAGRRRVRREFNLSRQVEATLDAYRQARARRKGSAA
ncbi:MAG: glycosyltransferase family 4 protein [Chloroflexota bacterium]